MDDLAALNPDVTTNCKYCDEEFTYTPVAKRQFHHENSPRTFKRKLRSVRNVCDKCNGDKKRIEKIKRYGVAAKDGPDMGDMTRWQTEQDRRYNILHKMVMIPNGEHIRISGNEWEMGLPLE